MVLRYDPVVGYLFVPNLKARVPSELGGYFLRSNSLGFRSDFEYDPRKGRKRRVLVFGDSFVAGDGVSNGERFADKLGELLGAETFNYGIPASGTDQQLLALEHYAKGVAADLIVLCVVVHNIERVKVGFVESWDRSRRRFVLVPKPYFDLEGNTLQPHHQPVPLERGDPSTVDRSKYLSPFNFHDRAIDNPAVALYSKLGHFPRELLSRFPVIKQKARQIALRSYGFSPLPDYDDEHSYGWRLLSRIIRRFAEVAGNTPLLVVPIPTGVYLKGEAQPTYQKLFDSLSDHKRSVHVGNITPGLVDHASRHGLKSLMLQKDSHPTPAGHSKIAALIANEIEQSGFLAPPTEVRKTVGGPRGASTLPILGISCFYHNSAAAIVVDGKIVAAAEEERFTRVKNDRRFPHFAINYCLEEAGINQDQLAAVVYYDNPDLTFERILHTHAHLAERGRASWRRVMPSWVDYKLDIPGLIRHRLCYDGEILIGNHHRSHAASAFYPSPFERAAILTVDGVGEWATASIGLGNGNGVAILKEMHFPHSLGLLYSAFTQFTGFKVNSGEYKMMGLAPYGEPRYVDVIRDHLVDLKEDGSVELNLDYFGFLSEPSMTSAKFAELFGGPARKPEERITRREIDLARSIQSVIEEVLLRMARHARATTGEQRLTLAGGVALNCVANGNLLRSGLFDDIWIQPAAGDAGAALGAALDAHHTYYRRPRVRNASGRSVQGGSCLGPAFSSEEIEAFLQTHGYPYRHVEKADRAALAAKFLREGKVVGHFAGRSEYGPRALGSRSILADARNPEMQANLNLKIKYRESFRPFAPAVLAERASEYFDLDRESPYMLLVAAVCKERRKSRAQIDGDDLLPVVRQVRSDIPAVTHVDYSARIQTVHPEDHSDFYSLLKSFEDATGTAVLVNTSFNVRGEPIVNTPYDAYRCFMRTEMDVLFLGNCVLIKSDQPSWPESGGAEEGDDIQTVTSEAEGRSNEITKIFDRTFLPIAEALQRNGGIAIGGDFRRVSSTWLDVEEASRDQGPARFTRRRDWRTRTPHDSARQLIGPWRHQVAAAAFIPVLDALLRVQPGGHDHSLADQESVPESIYVMY
jgi:carbamoyltransferase